MASHPKRPRDPNQLAHMMVGLAKAEIADSEPPRKNPAAVALGKLGGSKGEKVRASVPSSEERLRIAKKAAAARWTQKPVI